MPIESAPRMVGASKRGREGSERMAGERETERQKLFCFSFGRPGMAILNYKVVPLRNAT